MGLHIVVGYRSAENSADPVPVYAGRNAAQARAAMVGNREFVRFEYLPNPRVQRKFNPDHPSVAEARAAQNAVNAKAAEALYDAPVDEPVDPIAARSAQLDEREARIAAAEAALLSDSEISKPKSRR